MNIESYFREKINKIIFLNVSKNAFYNTFLLNTESEEIYLPIKSEELIKRVKKGDDLKEIKISEFVDGMATVISCDDKFKYNELYLRVLNSDKYNYVEILKGIISNYIKEEQYEEGYLVLKTLSKISDDEDIVYKLITLCYEIAKNNKKFNEELRKIIDEFSYTNYEFLNLYNGLSLKDNGEYTKALAYLKLYSKQNKNSEVNEIIDEISKLSAYEVGKKLIYDEPVEALELLLPLLNEFSDWIELYYLIGVCYRLIGENDKAINFIKKSLDSEYKLESLNELGLNYAILRDYKNAIKFFRENFEISRKIEVCTNLIMCYINIEDYESAKLHLEIGKKIDKNDEIIKELEVKLGGLKNED